MKSALERIATALEEQNRRRRNSRETEAEARALADPPRQISMAAMVRGCPDLGRAILAGKIVPDNYYSEIDVGVVEVACPCGKTPACRGDVPTVCACERAYIFVGGRLRVLFSPVGAVASEEGRVGASESG